MWGTSCFQKRKKNFDKVSYRYRIKKREGKITVIYLNFENIVSLNKTIKINNVN